MNLERIFWEGETSAQGRGRMQGDGQRVNPPVHGSSQVRAVDAK